MTADTEAGAPTVSTEPAPWELSTRAGTECTSSTPFTTADALTFTEGAPPVV